jgi:hypothetical protein
VKRGNSTERYRAEVVQKWPSVKGLEQPDSTMSMQKPLLHAERGALQDGWSISEEDGLWLAKVRLDKDLVGIGYCGSRGVALSMASNLAMQVIANRLRLERNPVRERPRKRLPATST